MRLGLQASCPGALVQGSSGEDASPGAGKALLPPGVAFSSYRIRPPLIKRSSIVGWTINFAVGCVHGCLFCYADSMNKLYPRRGLEGLVSLKWGYYFAVPSNMWEAIRKTPWWRWSGEWVFMSSMHDPYLPQLHQWASIILRKALSFGVRLIVHTRSVLVLKDLGLMSRYGGLARIHVSIPTSNSLFSRIIEPRVPPPSARLRVLGRAISAGVEARAAVSPIMPPNPYNPDVHGDLLRLARGLAEAGVRVAYGESLHPRGENMRYLSEALGFKISVRNWDYTAEELFHKAMNEYGIKSYWHPERY